MHPVGDPRYLDLARRLPLAAIVVGVKTGRHFSHSHAIAPAPGVGTVSICACHTLASRAK
jgi:hypothetical protein